MKVWSIYIAYWTSKAKNTHSEYVIFIAFPLQQLLHDRASLLSYTILYYIYTYNTLYVYFLCHLSLMLVLSINISLP